MWTKPIEIDDEEIDVLLVNADLGKADLSITTSDRIIVAPEYTAFTKHPIGVTSCPVAVKDGIINMGGLDGDELRPFWTSWKVSELALNFSDTKSEVEQASGRI
ncbi:hypothetical protein BLNAU_3989 [Blattamonas nauphoetae]|uniref:Uncharacterized protein n=1 Tax=Blattamonas nauphoetae TaxID=2049346 RepID=A0ABQ9YAV5_9EUKA|nr:hypothetical protein BLNAU_3989 [Blattamonas nauphoetae]